MAWAWAVLVLLVAVLPAAVWLRSRNLKPPREPYGSPIPGLARLDHWLYDHYQLANLDRSRVMQAVIEGRQLTEPRLRQAAHGLATAMLSGEAGVVTSRKQRVYLGADLCLMAVIVVVALVTGKYSMLAPLSSVCSCCR
jgi:hypothetical protein